MLSSRPGTRLQAMTCRLCLAMSWRIPAFARTHYILGVYRAALARYSVQPFDGRPVYFKSAERASVHSAHWARLMSGGLELHEVPGDHSSLVHEPIAVAWVEQLSRCLTRAQSEPPPVNLGAGEPELDSQLRSS